MMIFELVLILMTRPLIKSVRSILQLPHPVGTHKRAIQLPTVWPLHPRPGGDDCSHWGPAQEPGGQSERWSWYDSLLHCVIINLIMNAFHWVKAGKHYTTFAQIVLPRFEVWTSWPLMPKVSQPADFRQSELTDFTESHVVHIGHVIFYLASLWLHPVGWYQTGGCFRSVLCSRGLESLVIMMRGVLKSVQILSSVVYSGI